MTLFKQIALLVTLVFLLLAAVIIISDLNRTRSFMQGQLQTTAQDMATTLGIVISNLPDNEDPATLEVLFNSVFDSGYYSRIELLSVDNQTIHAKSQPVLVEGIPQWFIEVIPLTQARGTSQVMSGWTQLGRLEITLHPGFAYSGLYSTLLSTLQWFAVMFIMALVLLWLVLQYLLQPLQRVMQQADAIQNNQFVQQSTLPKTIDLKRVVLAMNNMVAKVQSIFDDQQKNLNHYQQLLYHDKVSGLGNRQYLVDNLQHALSEQSQFHGSLAMIKLVNYEPTRERLGYQVSDALIQKLSALLVWDDISGITTQHAARLNDDEFAFLISADEQTTEEYMMRIFEQFNVLLQEQAETELYLVGGISVIDSSTTLGELLSAMDYCLTQAMDSGPDSIEHRSSNVSSLPQGKMQWRKWLEQVIDENRLFMVSQRVRQHQGDDLHQELFIRACDEQGEIIPASAFMPMASNLGMSLDIDKAVFNMITQSERINTSLPLALNMSAAVFAQADAQFEFDRLLKLCHERGISLCIEASHHTLAQHESMCRQVADRVHQLGHQFGIDHLDIAQSLTLLQSAQFDYVKINAKTLQDISEDSLSAGYQALKTLTDTMNINLIAVGVDTEALHQQLLDLGILCQQGNYLHQAQTWNQEQ